MHQIKKLVISLFMLGLLVGCTAAKTADSKTETKEESSKTEKPQEKQTNVTKFDIQNEIKLDEAPIDFQNSLFVAKRDGYYFIIKSDNSTLLEDKQSSRYFDFNERVCLSSKEGTFNQDGDDCGPFGFEPSSLFSWNQQQNVSLTYEQYIENESDAKSYADLRSIYPSGSNMYEGKAFMLVDRFPTSDELSSHSGSKPTSFGPSVLTEAAITRINDLVYDDYALLLPYGSLEYITYNGAMNLEKLNAVKKDNKWALMNQNGELISDFEYDTIRMLSRSYFYFEKDGLSGVLDSEGQIKLIGEFEDASGIINDKAFIKQDGKWFEIKIITE